MVRNAGWILQHCPSRIYHGLPFCDEKDTVILDLLPVEDNITMTAMLKQYEV
jgi:hypothetical protein